MSSYSDTPPERFNAVETRAICIVPIDSTALGDPVDPTSGEILPAVSIANMRWVLSEVRLWLVGAEFCGIEIQEVSQAAPMKCVGTCVAGSYSCRVVFISEETRLPLRAFHGSSNRKRATWPDAVQQRAFQSLVDFEH